MNVLLIGNGAREHALAEAIVRSRHQPRLYAFMKSNNPGIAGLCVDYALGNYGDLETICAQARAGPWISPSLDPKTPSTRAWSMP